MFMVEGRVRMEERNKKVARGTRRGRRGFSHSGWGKKSSRMRVPRAKAAERLRHVGRASGPLEGLINALINTEWGSAH